MEEYINKWIYFEILYYKDDFQEINNLEYVSPEDRDFVKNNWTNRFYECVGIQGEYLIVKSKTHTIHIKPSLIKGFLPSPKFVWGEVVYEICKPEIKAVIEDFFWHHNKEQYLYYISVNGKKKSKQLSESELNNEPT